MRSEKWMEGVMRRFTYCGTSAAGRILLPVVTCVIAYAAGAQPLDYTFMAQRSFTSSLLKSLGDAGSALAGDISMGLYNPSLFYSSMKNGRGAVTAGYGRDSLFSRSIIPVAAGYANGKGATGVFYRYQSGENALRQNEMTLNFSGVLFENTDVQGSVDCGVNFRVEQMKLDMRDTLRIPVNRYRIDTAGNEVFLGPAGEADAPRAGSAEYKRFIVDIGFYQPDFIDHLDFGLVMRNLLGYTWTRESFRKVATDSAIADSIAGDDTIARFDRYYTFSDEKQYPKGWLKGRYRTLLFGVVYRVEPSATIGLFFPVDIELLGLFDKKVKNSFVFRGGAGLVFNQMITLRLGYAREPKTIIEGLTTFKNTHVFTGGAGILVSSVSLDFYLSQQMFGFTAGYRF